MRVSCGTPFLEAGHATSPTGVRNPGGPKWLARDHGTAVLQASDRPVETRGGSGPFLWLLPPDTKNLAHFPKDRSYSRDLGSYVWKI